MNVFKFGVEVEVPLQVQEGRELWDNTVKPIINDFEKSGHRILNRTGEGIPDEKDYMEDRIIQDPTCYENAKSNDKGLDGFLSFELSTKTYKYEEESEWKQQLSNIWRILEPYVSSTPEHWKRCSTHIHISFGDEHSTTPLGTARLLAFASILFQPAIDQYMVGLPDNDLARRGGWKSTKFGIGENHANDVRLYGAGGDRPKITDVRRIWRELQKQGSIQDIHNLVCFHDRPKSQMPFEFPNKKYTFNFKGYHWKTIEFRQLYPVHNEDYLVDCVEFICAFAHASTSVSVRELDRVAADATQSDEESRLSMSRVYGLKEAPSAQEHLHNFLGPRLRAKGLGAAFWDRMEQHRDRFQKFINGKVS